MKTVFSNINQAIHVWASQSQEHGHAGNVFFDGASIWSYGRHFRMAQFVRNERGERACLINPERYSVSTSRHQHSVRCAIPDHVPQFAAPNAEIDHAATIAYYEKESAEAFGKAKRARKAWSREYYDSVGRACLDGLNKYAEFFGLPDRAEMPADIESALAAAKVRNAERDTRDAAARAERERLAAIEAKREQRKARALLSQWKHGCDVTLTYAARALDVALRVRGDIIQTSHGAEVPLAVAPMLWDRVKSARMDNLSADYSSANIRIGHFQLRAIHACGDVQIGCHFIRYAELERMARALGMLVDDSEPCPECESTGKQGSPGIVQCTGCGHFFTERVAA